MLRCVNRCASIRTDAANPGEFDDASRSLFFRYGGNALVDLSAPMLMKSSSHPDGNWMVSTLDVDGEAIVVLFRAEGLS